MSPSSVLVILLLLSAVRPVHCKVTETCYDNEHLCNLVMLLTGGPIQLLICSIDCKSKGYSNGSLCQKASPGCYKCVCSKWRSFTRLKPERALICAKGFVNIWSRTLIDINKMSICERFVACEVFVSDFTPLFTKHQLGLQQKRKKTSAVKHKPARNWCSGRPNKTSRARLAQLLQLSLAFCFR